MTYQLIILDLATDDAKNAFEYYEDQQTGLGFRFETALVNTFEYIHKHPLHFKIEKKNFRQALVNDFPYLVIYYISKETIYIQRVFHTSRNPKKKFKK
ncbi:MAG: type II toxin-antitoxin system RelE/ParE family toxin [Chitinophagales bacterium]